MASFVKEPFFSIIISTRDRPELFQIALRSVLEQSFNNSEVIVVIDGSNETNLAQYRELYKNHEDIAFYELAHRPNGHGQSYAMNYGAHQSSGKYLCFLDDDDHWTDNSYLERLYSCLTSSEKPVDVHYSNQTAIYSDGTQNTDNVWIDDLIPRVSASQKNTDDCYFVDAEFLLTSGGFAHLNCSAFRKDFYLSLDGMDENIRYENDRDIYIRSIDAAKTILYSTRFVSLHNIPDVSKKSNMSTVSSKIEKKLYQLRVYDKGIALSHNPVVIRFCCKAKMYELKHAARILEQNKQYRSAAFYARSALANGFNFRWLAYTVYISLRAWLRPTSGLDEKPQ